MARHGIESACYIGDTQGDLDAAELAGIPFIYCAYGFGAVDHPWKTIDRFEDLLRLWRGRAGLAGALSPWNNEIGNAEE